MEQRKFIIDRLKNLAERNYNENHGPCQAAILAKENPNGSVTLLAEVLDNRIKMSLEHATMELINAAAGVGEYILTGLEVYVYRERL